MPGVQESVSKFEEAFNKVAAEIKDLATLDVMTLSGTINLAVTGAGGNSQGIDPTAFYERLKTEAASGSTIQVVAFTHKEVDSDSVVFVRSDADSKLLAAHQEMVKAADQARMDFLKFVGGLIKVL
jgi:hypothetical protein